MLRLRLRRRLGGFFPVKRVEIRGKIPGKMDEDGENLGMNQRKMNENLEIFGKMLVF